MRLVSAFMDVSPPRNLVDEDEGSSAFLPRRSGRLELSGATQMRCSDRETVEVVVRDISLSGFRADCNHPVLIGSYVSIDLPGVGAVQAQVRWRVGGRLGARFLDPVNLRRCAWLAPAG